MSNKYITLEELKTDPYNLTEDDTYLGVLQDMTKELIDKRCGQEFDAEGEVGDYVEKRVSGTGKDTIFLPKRLVTLHKIRIYSQNTIYTEFDAEEFFVKSKFISWNIYSDIQDSPRFLADDFPKGSYNVGIVGIWGYAETPAPIKYLQGKLIEKIVTDGDFADKMKSEQIGDYSYTLAEAGGQSKVSITGDVALDMIFKQYQEWSYGAV